MLRPYQQRASDAIMDWARKCKDPCLLEAATGAGKSHVIADVAHNIQKASGKSVLCMAPSAELVHQNRDKYLATGNPASIYSASGGRKCLRHPVVFGTPGTLVRATDKIADRCAAVIVDEAHGMTPTVRKIISELRGHNPRLRVVGLTATPYRLDSGYIYASDPDGQIVEQANDPYFARLVDRIPAHELIGQGYLTPPVIGGIEEHYDTSALELGRNGQYTASSQERAFEGHGRKTSKIIADIVERSRDRMGVIIFAATVQHAQECMASLPPGMSEIVTGSTGSSERKQILADFKAQRVKYLVNVSVLTTGFDAEHIDVVALLRHTESAGLMQQMIGRGLRLHPYKNDCLVLDYAENIESHTPDGDLFNPVIAAPMQSSEVEKVPAVCEWCGTENLFSVRPNPDGYSVDENGYWLDLDGVRVEGDHGAMPAHYGRRCMGTSVVAGSFERCGYYWSYRECPECGAENDIAARYCNDCRSEIVDPNEKLRIEFAQKKSDPYQVQTDEVLTWTVQDTLSRSGNPMLRVGFSTAYNDVTVFYLYEHTGYRARKDWQAFRDATDSGKHMPRTITYYRDRASKFWRIVAYNENPDMAPDLREY